MHVPERSGARSAADHGEPIIRRPGARPRGRAPSTGNLRRAGLRKLRARGLVASGLWIFAHSDTFRPELTQHAANRTVALPAATSDTMLVLGVVRKLLRGLLRDGIGYKKAGVALLDLARPDELQADLFGPTVVGIDRLMATMDQINQKFGRGTADLGASGWQARPAWGMRQHILSPNYTTSVQKIPRAWC